MRIGNNISAMNTLNRLSFNNSSVSKSLEKLSSGSAINRASDDAAGLAISEKMRAQIAGLEQASKNAQDGISLVQTAEGALDQTHTALRRMYTLAMQATNGTITAEDRQKIQDEIDARVNEIDRVADTANFNGIKLFDGSLAGPVTPAQPATAAALPTIDGVTNGSDIADVDADAVTIAYDAGATDAQRNALNTALQANDITVSVAVDGSLTAATLTGYNITAAGGGVVTGESIVSGTANLEIQDADGNVVATLSVTGGADAAAAAGAGDVVISFNADGVQAAAATEATTSSFIPATAPTAPADVVEIETGLEVTMGAVSFAEGSTMAQQNALLEAMTGGGITFTTTSTGAGAGNITGIAASLGTYSFSEIDLASTDAQTLTISDANGNEIGSVSITLSEDVTAFTTALDAGDYTATAAAYTGGTQAQAAGLKLQIGASSDGADQINVEVADMHAAQLLGFEDGQTTLDVSTADNAHAAIDNINAAIERVSTQRAALGAVQNRLEQTIENLTTTAENMSAAESRIRDVDMAKEMTNFTKFSILSQAAQAMLAQANALPQGVLQLLG